MSLPSFALFFQLLKQSLYFHNNLLAEVHFVEPTDDILLAFCWNLDWLELDGIVPLLTEKRIFNTLAEAVKAAS